VNGETPTSNAVDLTEIEASADPSPLLSGDKLLGAMHPDDWTRVGLAAGLVILLSLLVLGSGIVIALRPDREAAIESYLKLVFTPVVGLVASVTGFYFGSRQSESTRERR
jgi:hypothetical protein